MNLEHIAAADVVVDVPRGVVAAVLAPPPVLPAAPAPFALLVAPPGNALGCVFSNEWVTAIGEGLIVRSSNGEVIQDLDGDGYPEVLDAFGNPILYSFGLRTPRAAEVWSMGADGVVDALNDGVDRDANGTQDGLIDEREDSVDHVPELVDDIVSW